MTIETSSRVYWITGLAGAGKTTVGRLLVDRLRKAGRPAIFLDGDAVRSAVADDLGYDGDDRRRSATRISRLCHLLASQGFDVICATISLLHDVQRWNRANISHYHEIYLRVPLSVLEQRDPKGLYKRARHGEVSNIVGIDVPIEEPEQPDIVIDSHGATTPEDAVDLIWRKIVDPNMSETEAPSGPHIPFGTKAETLEILAGLVSSASVLPQVRFTVADWRQNSGRIVALISGEPWATRPMIVRSSASQEDSAMASHAGQYKSVGGVTASSLGPAVEEVIDSYGCECDSKEQVFVQPMLTEIALAGVAFTSDPNSGGPYLVINYDDQSSRADTVTSGGKGKLKTFYRHHNSPNPVPSHFSGVVRLVDELRLLCGNGTLDIEFAVDGSGKLFLLQVRPLAADMLRWPDIYSHSETIGAIARKVALLNRPHPFFHGRRTIFGVMPDWNPAEIIGIRPRPLALSLYRDLVTDSIWAYQRDNYGYKNLRSVPLLVSFHGLPYIDVRVSFNSFVPSDINGDLAERLVNYYVDRLQEQPDLHDKVEFEIIHSCYTLDLPQRLVALRQHGFSAGDTDLLADSLRHLTNRIIHGETGLWRRDREKIDILDGRLPHLAQSGLDTISRIYWLLEDCKRYGTLPFAGLARAGFIAVQILRSLVSVGVLNENEYSSFMADLDTVGSRMVRDLAMLPKPDFLNKYGHLRPGTYDILSARYDEDPNRYFDWAAARRVEPPQSRFSMSVEQMRRIDQLLKEYQLEHDVIGLMEFIKAAIEGREHAKFVFTRNLSDALSLIAQLGTQHGLSREDCAFLDINVIQALYGESGFVGARLAKSSAEGRRNYEMTQSIVLPPLIAGPEDCWSFHLPPTQPNFITQRAVTAPVASLNDPPEAYAGKILFIPSADPGFDWIFTRNIGGFVTQFGGVNSHMAIRAGELGLPAVIGAGEMLFRRWGAAHSLSIDCRNRQVQILS